MSLTLELPEELGERLKRAAAARGMALDDFVRPALEALAGSKAAAPVSAEDEWAAHLAHVDPVCGSLAHLPGSVDEFLAEKHAENEREEARWQMRQSA